MPKAKTTAVDAYIGARLRELRKAHKESQTDIGDVLGVSYAQVQKIELGTNRITATALLSLAQHFGVPLADFFPNTTSDTPLRRKAVRPPDPNTEAAQKFAASKRGFDLLRAVAAIRDEAVQESLVDFAKMLARRTNKPKLPISSR